LSLGHVHKDRPHLKAERFALLETGTQLSARQPVSPSGTMGESVQGFTALLARDEFYRGGIRGRLSVQTVMSIQEIRNSEKPADRLLSRSSTA
jgi:hypothetical protein